MKDTNVQMMTHRASVSGGHWLTSGRGIGEEKSRHRFGLQAASHLAGEVSSVNLETSLPESTRFLHEMGIFEDLTTNVQTNHTSPTQSTPNLVACSRC